MVPNLLLDNIITQMKYSTPSTIKLLIIQGFSDEILIKHEIGLESAGKKTLPSVKFHKIFNGIQRFKTIRPLVGHCPNVSLRRSHSTLHSLQGCADDTFTYVCSSFLQKIRKREQLMSMYHTFAEHRRST
jgi:hypothetical protein